MQRIEIRNFKQIREADIQVNNLTLLIGEQASGKSTVAKLVYFFKSLRKDFVEIAREKADLIDSMKLLNTVRDKFYLYFGSTQRFAEDYSIVYHFSDQLRIRLSGSPLRVYFEPHSVLIDGLQAEVSRAAVLVNFYREKLDMKAAQREEDILEDALCHILNDYVAFRYIPAGRNITVAYNEVLLKQFQDLVKIKTTVEIDPETGLPKRKDPEEIDLVLLRDFIADSQGISKAFQGVGMEGVLREIEPLGLQQRLKHNVEQILKAKYHYSESKGEYLKLRNGQTVTLGRSSSGQQESIRIIQDAVLQIAKGDPVFRVIEEPEAHLSPSGQHRLIEIMAVLANVPNSGNEILITTHSPYILTILNNLILAGELAEDPGKEHELDAAGIPALFRLKPTQVSAYMLNSNGSCTALNHNPAEDISDSATGLIGSNVLEDYWNELYNQYEALYGIGVGNVNV